MLSDFGYPTGAYNGILASALPLGSVIGLPLIPLINDTFGRRWCIMFGSCIMIIGTIIQGFAINGEPSRLPQFSYSRAARADIETKGPCTS